MTFKSDLSDVQRTVLAFVAVPTGVLSLTASFLIIVMICRSQFSSYRRILLGLSASDMLVSITYMTGPFVIPKESSVSVWDYGNTTTCHFHGALGGLALSNTWYSAFLAVYFLCTIRNGWSPKRFAHVLEPGLHVGIIAFAVTASVLPLGFDWYRVGRIGPGCWIAVGDDDSAQRQIILRIFQCIFTMGPFGLSLAIIAVANLAIYMHVRSLTKNSLRRSMNPSVGMKRKRLVASQSFCYVAAYAVTYMACFIMGMHDLFGGAMFSSKTSFFVFEALQCFLMPLTGVLNLMVFLRPLYVKKREQHPSKSRWWCFQQSFRTELAWTRRRPANVEVSEQIQTPQEISDVEPAVDCSSDNQNDSVH